MDAETAAEVAARVAHQKKALESYLHSLEDRGWWYGWNNQTGSGMLVPYGVWYAAKRNRKSTYDDKVEIWENKAHSFQTGRPGCPDYVGIYKGPEHSVGRFVAIEAKSGTGRLTEEQKYCRKIVELLGGLFIEYRVLADVEDVLYRRRTIPEDPVDISDVPF